MNHTTLFITSLLISLAELRAAEPVDFVRDVRPIFEKHCYDCHAGAEQESGLRLDIKESTLKGGDQHGPDIVPGKAQESPLIRFVNTDDKDSKMPPDGRLSNAEIETLTQWINEGAVWPDGVDRVRLGDKRDHWSFKPLTAPIANLNSQNSNPIDNFIKAKLADNGLTMSPETDRVSWLRRVSFDLVGLPPTPEQMNAFLQDERRDAFESVVDNLLVSERYGERWAQHWLDVVRYADTHGFEVNTERPNAWPYRDYVIRAFNNDTPYDRFIKEQIVGDALGEDAATGFLVTASVLLPGQIGKDAPSIRLARQDSLDEIVSNIGQTFLGLSIGCARCHDHKFDPITAKDYYAMQAFVAGVEYEDRALRTPESEARKKEVAPLREQVTNIDHRLAQFVPIAQPGSHHRATDAKQNVETFPPIEAKFVRFTIHDANLHPSLGLIEPCIDEFEILTDEPQLRNVALATHGTKVTASGSNISTSHKLEHINDGKFGNSQSWMSSEAGRGWVLFELPESARISKIIWSRDREGEFGDRLATAYTLEAGPTIDAMKTLAEVYPLRPTVDWKLSADRFAPVKTARLRFTNLATNGLRLSGLPPDEAMAASALLDEKQRLEARIKNAQQGQLAFAGQFRAPDEIRLLSRGDPEQPNEDVLPAVITSIGNVCLCKETPEQDRRLALADWIADPKNPLTARVMANRIWQWHFGIGLVATPSDFGNNGLNPSHPELLDWLATEFVRSGWSIKHLHRLIVLSETYRQASVNSLERKQDNVSDALTIDAEVRLLWRYPSRRIEAETIRDSMLAVSGLMNPKMYGSGFDLFDKRGGLSGFNPIETLNPENQRRMIYAHKVRRETEAVFGAFDCPDAGQSTALRRHSTTPIQALNLLNSRFTLDVAAAFSQRVIKEAGDRLEDQIQHAYRLSLNRNATSDELQSIEPIVREHGLPVLCRVLFNSNEFLFIP